MNLCENLLTQSKEIELSQILTARYTKVLIQGVFTILSYLFKHLSRGNRTSFADSQAHLSFNFPLLVMRSF